MATTPDTLGNVPRIRATKDANGTMLPVNRKTTQTVRSGADTTMTATTVPEGATEVTIWATTASDGTAAAAWSFGGVGSSAGTTAKLPSAMGPTKWGCAGAANVYTAAQSGTVDLYLVFGYCPDDDL